MDLVSFAIPKDSVFKPFLTKVAIKIIHDGHVSFFVGRSDKLEISRTGTKLVYIWIFSEAIILRL